MHTDIHLNAYISTDTSALIHLYCIGLCLEMYQALNHSHQARARASPCERADATGFPPSNGLRVVAEDVMCRLWAETYLMAYLRYVSISVGLFCVRNRSLLPYNRSLLTLPHTSGMQECLSKEPYYSKRDLNLGKETLMY